MKDTEYIALEVPVFALLIGAELFIARRQGRRVYRLNDFITDLSCGMGQQVTGIFARALVFGAYVWVYRRLALTTLPLSSWTTWVLAFAGVDFLYYWFHRLGHEINLLWAVHVVHHQSEDYNIAVALRQTWFSDFTGMLFYWPMPFLGVPLEAFLVAASFLALYQTWLHTSVVGDLGRFGWLFNTPSHHRVHHGRDAKYLDKNYGATLILWDRLFGTFQREEETPRYGISRPLRSWNPLWAQVSTFAELTALMRAARRPKDKWRVWWKRPGFIPEGAEDALPAVLDRTRYDARCSPAVSVYILVQFLLTAAAATVLLFSSDRWSLLLDGALVALVLLTTLVWSGLFEAKRWATPLEVGRLLAIAALGSLASYWIVVLAAGCLVWFVAVRLPAPLGETQWID